MATVTLGSAITGFLSTLNHFGANSLVPSFLLVISLCSCHCLLTPPVRTRQGKWQEPDHGPWSRCRAEKAGGGWELWWQRSFLQRPPMDRHLPWINNGMNEAYTPTPPRTSAHTSWTLYTLLGDFLAQWSLKTHIFIVPRKRQCLLLLFKLEEFPHDFLSSVAEWLFEPRVSLLSWISNQLGHMAIGRCLSLHMMDM